MPTERLAREEGNEEFRDGDEGFVSKDPLDHAHNSHWLRGPSPSSAGSQISGPSRFVAYYDAASLYPSSGKRLSFFFQSV